MASGTPALLVRWATRWPIPCLLVAGGLCSIVIPHLKCTSSDMLSHACTPGTHPHTWHRSVFLKSVCCGCCRFPFFLVIYFIFNDIQSFFVVLVLLLLFCCCCPSTLLAPSPTLLLLTSHCTLPCSSVHSLHLYPLSQSNNPI